MSKINERYWAVRVGDPRKHTTYLALDHRNANGLAVPALFLTQDDAERHAERDFSGQVEVKPVRVRITAR